MFHMLYPLKKLIFTIIFNGCLFSILVIGIQNSSEKSKVNFLGNESIKLPISFIVGTSFISGSIFVCFLPLESYRKKE